MSWERVEEVMRDVLRMIWKGFESVIVMRKFLKMLKQKLKTCWAWQCCRNSKFWKTESHSSCSCDNQSSIMKAWLTNLGHRQNSILSYRATKFVKIFEVEKMFHRGPHVFWTVQAFASFGLVSFFLSNQKLNPTIEGGGG